MSDAFKTAIVGVIGLAFLVPAYLFSTAHDEVKVEMIKAVPLIVTAAFAGSAAVLTAYGVYQIRMQGRALATGHQQLAKTVREEADKVDSTVRSTGAKVAVVTVKKAQQTQDKVDEVHELVNGGPNGLTVTLKKLLAETIQEVLAQATERIAASTERGQAKESRERMTGKKETDQAIPTAARTQLVDDLKELKDQQ